MTDNSKDRKGRPRLDPGARERILAEIARLDRPLPPAEPPGPSGLDDLRKAVLEAQEAMTPEPVAPPLPPVAEPAPIPAEAAPPAPAPPGAGMAGNWSALATIPVDPAQMERNLIITAARIDPAHGAFDVLRTRMVQAMAERGWKRVGITSPTKGCGKSFTALNLAVALSRYDRSRTVLLDMDLRIPALAKYLGVSDPGSIGDMLRGLTAPAQHLRRFAPNGLHIGGNVALGLNDRRESFAAELFQDPATAATLDRIDAEFAPDIMLFDLPPALAQDDVIALRPLYDCILMVVGGGKTTPRELRESIRRIGEDKPVLGMILNKADGEGVDEYAY